MFRELLKGSKHTLVHDAVSEVLRMLEQGHTMFQTACGALLAGQDTEGGLPQDAELNVGERVVRRMVFQHLVVDPQRDLTTSVSLLSIVHDVERIGDYSKSLVELSRWAPGDPCGPLGQHCQQLHTMVEPEFGGTLKALRDSDEDAARQVMRDHTKAKALTDQVLEQAMELDSGGREVVVYAVASRYLRRVSAHLSNVASVVINPVDQVSGKEAK
jgi:Na+/phosphate symporter